MGNQTDYFERIGYTPIWYLGDRVFGYWNNRNNLFGAVVEVRADAITQNQDGTYSLRFPRFLRFRGFEAGEKL